MSRTKKLTKGQKAWATRRANAAKVSLKNQEAGTYRIELPNDYCIADGPANLLEPVNLTLCQQLEETISRFEVRISNAIGRLNSLMGKV